MTDKPPQPLTDTDYWDKTWAHRLVPSPLDPHARGLNGTVPRYWHRFFSRLFQSLDVRPGDRLLEAGCGGSVFLPYFVREFGLNAEGIDNSAEGCELSRAIARQSGIHTPIYCNDVLDPPLALARRYQVVLSFGLAEHFTPTRSIIDALIAWLQPDGYLITIVPNMHGVVGVLQRLVDPAVYRVHVPLSPSQLADAHSASGLTVCDAAHLMTVNFSAVNFSGAGSRVPPRFGLRLASWASKLVWTLEGAGLPEIRNRWSSPYVVVVARHSQPKAA